MKNESKKIQVETVNGVMVFNSYADYVSFRRAQRTIKMNMFLVHTK